ncbi:energy transducer TonB [Glacieibacterium frigidum]|uniref:Energy transducer TonB n=1 Tax=Glacieibacterium frigidum TaxID=2593303 RepID=A0A552U848_9SPHN|nr:energy transducer TonB [Glacieibacterium frigidum]TRW14382.1 energy transducer TonB [Glacieibacterium frigidum]
MQFAQNASSRNSTGLVVTIAVHAGLVALALAATGIATVYNDPTPFEARNIVDTPPPPTRTVEPRTIEQPIAVTVDRPEFETVVTPVRDVVEGTATATATTGGSAVSEGRDEPVIAIVEPPARTGITRRAALDPRYARDFEAPYPPASQRNGEEGTVLVRVVIGADGRVTGASIARSSGFARLDDAALKRALAKWRFVPAMDNGVAVEATRDVPVTFRLQD